MDANYKKFDYSTIFCDKCDYSCQRKDQIELHHSTKHEGFRFNVNVISVILLQRIRIIYGTIKLFMKKKERNFHVQIVQGPT